MSFPFLQRIIHDPGRAWQIAKKKIRAPFWNYYSNKVRDPKVVMKSDFFSTYHLQETGIINNEIVRHKIKCKDLLIDPLEFNEYLIKCQQPKFENYFSLYKNVLNEKLLQHFVAAKLLEANRISAETIYYIDIASEGSIAPYVYKDLFGWQVFRQDLNYKKGIHGQKIGGNAAEIPLPDESIHLMALHCSFEHFEDISDVQFIREAQRILKPDGRVVIAPLYLSSVDRVATDPVVSVPERVTFPEGTEVVCIPRFWNRFARLYSIQTLSDNILSQWTCGNAWIVRCTNANDVQTQPILRYALVLEKS